MKGFKIIWSLLSWCSFRVPLFSAWLSISFENHSLNSSWESKRVGMMKWSKAQSSSEMKQHIISYGMRGCASLCDCVLTLHTVLDRCTSKQQTISAVETKQNFPSSTCWTLDSLSLIQHLEKNNMSMRSLLQIITDTYSYHILPFNALEVLYVSDNLRNKKNNEIVRT